MHSFPSTNTTSYRASNHSSNNVSILLLIDDLMGDFYRAKLLAPNVVAHDGAVPIAGKPQPLHAIRAHEFAEWALLSGMAIILGGEICLVVTAGFGVDEGTVR